MGSTDEQQLYLVWIDPSCEVPDIVFDGDAVEAADNLWFLRSGLSRSKAYHRIKWQLPENTALLVAPLPDDKDGWPKFKGMNAGALAWLRG